MIAPLRAPARRLRARVALLAAAVVLGGAAAPGARAAELAAEVGRSEVRVQSAPYRLAEGVTVTGAGLPERLERLGYRRVHRRPERPGEFFWGHEVFWIHRRAHRVAGRDRDSELLRLELRRADGRVLEVAADHGEGPGRPRAPWLEPELLAESLTPDRARRRPIELARLPEHVWRAVLAIEDARFFDHRGVDPRSVARAAIRNALSGRVTQGGSTLTQQLVKNRDLTPKRTFGRKLSEAVRALALEAEYPKEEILEAYLDTVYWGHLDGVAVYGLGAASRAWFGKPPEALDLAEAALLAGMIQGPNRLHPVRHPERALARQRAVLERLRALGWAGRDAVDRARRALPRLAPSAPPPAGGAWLGWVRELARREAPRRLEAGRGVVVETALDPWLLELAEGAVGDGLAELRRARPALAGRPLAAALVAIDGVSGDLLAHVGGDPGRPRDDFDRVRRARRQPGSVVKPLVLLEAFESCGRRAPLHGATRVADGPLTIDLASGPWRPRNPDGRHRDAVDLREALALSLNLPMVRVARWCGFAATAARLRRAGLPLPRDAPPAFVLGAVESSPLELAAAYSLFAGGGRRVEPRLVRRLERPGGRRIERLRADRERVVDAATAYLVRDLLREAVERGTASAARVEGLAAWGKTGTSSERRDAWFVGGAGRLVTAVWVGLDDGSPLGFGGTAAAAPIWRRFMAAAAGALPPERGERPRSVVERWVDPATGLRVAEGRPGARRELFRRGDEPPRRSLLGWRRAPAPIE